MTEDNSRGERETLTPIRVQLTHPVCRCAQEEAVFHSRIAELPGLQRVSSNREGIQLIVLSDSLAMLERELEALCEVWGTGITWPDGKH